MTSDHLRRLMIVDAALASEEGLHVATLVVQLGVSSKTLERDRAVLSEVAGAIDVWEVQADNLPGHIYVHRYCDPESRLFADRPLYRISSGCGETM